MSTESTQQRRHGPVFLAVMIGCCCLTGCHTWQKSHQAALSAYMAGDLNQSTELLQTSMDARGAEQHVLRLDDAIVRLASGDAAAAENELRAVRREMEVLEENDATEQASALLTDDRAVAFAGRDFERDMLLSFLMLTSIVHDGQDAFAYALQLRERAAGDRQLLVESARKVNEERTADGTVVPASFSSEDVRLMPSIRQQPWAMSSYLSAAILSESPTRAQETDAAEADIGFWNPDFRLRDDVTESGAFGGRSRPGHGTLHVIALVGRAPVWVPETAAPTSAALLIADRILSATGKHTLPPTVAPVRIGRPEQRYYLAPPGSVRCSVSAGQVADAAMTFHTLVDVGRVADASYAENRDQEIARAITRRVVKKGAVYVLKETQNIHRNSFVDLGVNVAGVVWEAMEKPDMRSWQLLPGRIEVAHVELPAGDCAARLTIAGTHDGVTIPAQIRNGRNTFVVCFVPDHRLTGQVLVGGADQRTVAVGP